MYIVWTYTGTYTVCFFSIDIDISPPGHAEDWQGKMKMPVKTDRLWMEGLGEVGHSGVKQIT